MKYIDPTTYPARHPLTQAMRLLSRYWYLTYSKLMSLRWVESTQCAYAATDGRTLWLNPSGLEHLATLDNGTELTAYMLAHESLHALLGHGWRVGKLPDQQAAQAAADYTVNALIDRRNRELNRTIFAIPPTALLDESLSGDLSVEQLYRVLTKPQPPQEPNEDNEKQQEPDSDNSGMAAPDAAVPDGNEGDPAGPEGRPKGGADSPPDAGSGSGQSEAPAELPSGIPSDDDGNAPVPMGGNPSGDSPAPVAKDPLADFVGSGQPDNLPPQVEPDESESEVTDRIEQDNERILIAAELDSKTQSDSGTTGQRVAAQRVDGTKLDWADLTREWVRKHSRCGWDSPYNPVIHGATGLVCAGRHRKTAGTVVLVLDTSGSIGAATYAKFLQQGQSVLDELRPEQLVLLSVSHKVADVVLLESGDSVPTKLKGGGGTRFQPAFDWVAANDVQPEFMLYLTDGYASDRQTLKPVDYPLLWLSTSVPASGFPIGDVLEITNI